MKVLVTGAAGMIGSYLVKSLLDNGVDVIGLDRRKGSDRRATHIVADLGEAEMVKRIVEEYRIDRIIHLAALAHTAGETDLSYEKYYHINVECAENVFSAADGRPVLFISTVDVYGFTKGLVNAESEPHPVSVYGKTKALAEEECKKICRHYTIFRLSPVYTETIKRDIQKRYYLRYPGLAYRIGKGCEYEVLDIRTAVSAMVNWCFENPENEVRIIKDPFAMRTADVIKAEKAEGRAKVVLYFPRWLIASGYVVLRTLTGQNKYTYLLHKAVYPLKTE